MQAVHDDATNGLAFGTESAPPVSLPQRQPDLWSLTTELPDTIASKRRFRCNSWATAKASAKKGATLTICLSRFSWIGCVYALVFTVCASLAIAEPIRLTLDMAMDLALSDNYTLLAKQNELASVRSGEITAGLTPNPQAGYTASNLGGKRGAYGRTDNSVTLQQTFETARKRERRVDFAQAGSRVTGSELEDVRRTVRLQVKTAFTGVLAGKAKLELAKSNLKNLNEVETLQKLRAEKGDISDLDLLRIQGQRLAFETDASDAELSVKTAKVALRQAISQERLPETFDVVGSLKYQGGGKLDRENLRSRAEDLRPDLQAAASAIEKSQADLNLAHAKAVPDIVPQVGFNDTHDNGQYWSLGATMNLPLFDRNQGEIARAKADIAKASRLRDASRAQVIADVDTAYATVVSTREKYNKINGTYVPKAKTVRDRVELSYRKGAANLLDYLEAQRSYRETSKAAIAALSDLVLAQAQLEAAVGEPLN